MQRRADSGFTLLELLTGMMIIAILALMITQSMGNLQARADFGQCLTNIRGLYIGAGAYLQEQEHWPQISPRLNQGGSTVYAERWIDALQKYGVPRKAWICPTVQRNKQNPDIEKREHIRTDYIATPFDSKPNTPRIWANQPWFIEKSNSHDGGNLIIFSDGSAMPLKEALKRDYKPL